MDAATAAVSADVEGIFTLKDESKTRTECVSQCYLFGESLVKHRGDDVWLMSPLAPIGSC